MAGFSDFKFSLKTRLCKVDNEIGLFHCWEQYSDVIPPGIMIGSHPGGQIARLNGIVEFEDGVRRVDPTNIKFIDEDHEFIHGINETIDKENIQEHYCPEHK